MGFGPEMIGNNGFKIVFQWFFNDGIATIQRWGLKAGEKDAVQGQTFEEIFLLIHIWLETEFEV